MACDCDEYEIPKEGNNCDYCDCKPTKHEIQHDREEAILHQQEAPYCKRTKMAIDLQDEVFSDVAAVSVIDETPCVGLQEEEDESFVKMVEEIHS